MDRLPDQNPSSGHELDLPPPESGGFELSLLMQGAKKIARARGESERILRRANQVAKSRFDELAAEGVSEAELIEYVERTAGVPLDVAAYVVDELRATGIARKDRVSGHLYPAR